MLGLLIKGEYMIYVYVYMHNRDYLGEKYYII